jgi:hypothetical protein
MVDRSRGCREGKRYARRLTPLVPLDGVAITVWLDDGKP